MKKLTYLFLAGLLAFSIAACDGSSSDDEDNKTEDNGTEDNITEVNPVNDTVTLSVLGTYSTGIFDESAAEIVVYDDVNNQLFVVNGDTKAIDVIGIDNLSAPVKLDSIDLSAYGDGINSVAYHNGYVAAAVEVEAEDDLGTQLDGKVVFFTADNFTIVNTVSVGALPDMVTFTPDGNGVVVANEGEPNDDYSIDPEGSVSYIDISGGVESASVTEMDFTSFNDHKDSLKASGVRITGPEGTTVAQDVEPEYIAVSADSKKAYVSLQENNAMAVADLEAKTIAAILPYGYKDHSLEKNSFDMFNKDEVAKLETHPIRGLYMPDAIAAFTADDSNYIITANEGDGREYATEDENGDDIIHYIDEEKLEDMPLDNESFSAEFITLAADGDSNLRIITTEGDTDKDGAYEELYSFGTRSFSIWSTAGELVYDSGNDFERITAEMYPNYFNASNDSNDIDDRSDNKGPEPEGVTVGVINDATFAFIGLERMGGIMVYNVSNPAEPKFVQYINNRDFTKDPETELAEAGDLGPEGLYFIPASKSKSGKNLLVVGNEVSGTTTIYEVSYTEATE
ncbi:choice-of-anchor I family protein [Limisalsivibrio acetivorans]|uniref:choice-of-anchor I family protein n=1 Tax=Limisalsivibrio acetivorans TaxID=1304888 RepID=UPI0003B35F6D|nr:choice-of-anchor I family protein [Limisalsivibrio acetivorans]